MFAIEFDVSPVRQALRVLRRRLDDHVERAVRRIGRDLRDEARASHAYRDRTGRLTASTRAEAPTGSFLRDTLEGGVRATAPYARYVEEGTTRSAAYQFLGTAWVLRREESEARVADALEAAVHDAGLR